MSIDKKKVLMIAAIGVPLIIGGYLIYKSLFAQKAGNGKTDLPKPKPNPTPTPTQSDYPIQQGSKGDLVKNLQVLLNAAGASPALVVDGVFGKKTEAALLQIGNRTKVTDESDFNSLKNDIKSQNAAANLQQNNLDYGWDLLDDYNNTNNTASSQVNFYDNVVLTQITQNLDGTWKLTSNTITVPYGNYPMSQYIYESMLADGSLRIQVIDPITGANQGMYSTNANLSLANIVGFTQ
jgi:peptidoglycan hydrolase-like protein with peptidoglycan-binding domain